MSIQDKLERILREMHLMVSRGQVVETDEEYVLIHKKIMQQQLTNLSEAVNEMMEFYDLTVQGRNRAELEAENQRMEILRNANHQSQDIYAASVLYSEDALGRIQRIIDAAEKSVKETLSRLSQEMEQEKRVVRSNQLELITQLEDMKDSQKYMRLIQERNREIEKEKENQKLLEEGRSGNFYKKAEKKSESEMAEEITADVTEEKQTAYEKPVIKINREYFQKLESLLDEPKDDEETDEEKKEKRQKFFSFGRKG